LIEKCRSTLEFVADGNDIWDRTKDATKTHWQSVLHQFAAEPSSAQNQERLVNQPPILRRQERVSDAQQSSWSLHPTILLILDNGDDD
jgi:hypothetical protein